MPNSSPQNSKSPLSCLGCLGNLITIIFVGCLIYGYIGFSVKLGNYGFNFDAGTPPKTDVDLANIEKTVSEAANQFHEDFSQGHFNKIYDQADKQFRESISLGDFIRLCQIAQTTSGTLKSTQLLDVWKPVNEQKTGKYILSRHYAIFSNLSVEEQIVWLLVDGKLVIVRYQQNPISPTAQFGTKETI